MRHNNKINALGRKSAHRKAMLSNMASSLIMHKRIYTTLAKAKALRVYVEPIITKSKEDTTHSRRQVFSYLQDKDAVSELFREVSPKILERPGGYTRILKTGKRLGDAAEMCFIELVDFNEAMLAAQAATEAKTTRRSRRGSKKKAEAAVEEKAKTTSSATKPEKKATVEKETENKTASEDDNAVETEVEAEEEVNQSSVDDKKVESEEPEMNAEAAQSDVKAEKEIKNQADSESTEEESNKTE